MLLATLALWHTLIGPAPVIHTGAAQHRTLDRVMEIRIARKQLPASARSYKLRVSSPHGRLGSIWNVCSVATKRCYRAIQVDVSRAKDVPYQLKTQAGLEVPPAWYPVLGCSRNDPPKRCRVSIQRIR